MVDGSRLVRWSLRLLVVAYLFFLVAWPSSLVVQRTFENGLAGLQEALSDPDVVHALQLTVVVAVTAVVINLVFGVGVSLRQCRTVRRATIHSPEHIVGSICGTIGVEVSRDRRR